MTCFLKGNVFWRIHHSADIFFNLCALSTSLQVGLSTGIARAHICQCETSTAWFCTDKTPQISHREYAKFQSILSTCKLLQSQYSPFHSQLFKNLTWVKRKPSLPSVSILPRPQRGRKNCLTLSFPSHSRFSPFSSSLWIQRASHS